MNFRRLFRIPPPCPHPIIKGAEVKHYVGGSPEVVFYCEECVRPYKVRLPGLSQDASLRTISVPLALVLRKKGYRTLGNPDDGRYTNLPEGEAA